MRYTALLLAFWFVALPVYPGGYLLDQSSKTDILTTLDGLEANLQTLKQALNQSQVISEKLKKDLETLSLTLIEVREKLQSSEASLEAAKAQLTRASLALTELEKSFNDYRFWSDVRFYSLAVVAGLLGVALAVK